MDSKFGVLLASLDSDSGHFTVRENADDKVSSSRISLQASPVLAERILQPSWSAAIAADQKGAIESPSLESRAGSSVVRSLGSDMQKADKGFGSRASRKWRADAEKSARLGEELQAIVVEQDHHITQLTEESKQAREAWEEERQSLLADKQIAVESARRECAEVLEQERERWQKERQMLVDSHLIASEAVRQEAAAQATASADAERKCEASAPGSCFWS